MSGTSRLSAILVAEVDQQHHGRRGGTATLITQRDEDDCESTRTASLARSVSSAKSCTTKQEGGPLGGDLHRAQELLHGARQRVAALLAAQVALAGQVQVQRLDRLVRLARPRVAMPSSRRRSGPRRSPDASRPAMSSAGDVRRPRQVVGFRRHARRAGGATTAHHQHRVLELGGACTAAQRPVPARHARLEDGDRAAHTRERLRAADQRSAFGGGDALGVCEARRCRSARALASFSSRSNASCGRARGSRASSDASRSSSTVGRSCRKAACARRVLAPAATEHRAAAALDRITTRSRGGRPRDRGCRGRRGGRARRPR